MAELKTKDNKERMDTNQTLSKHKGLALPDLKAHLIFWSLTIVGLVLDLWTKKAVFDWLEDRQTYPVIDGFLQMVRALNDGAAWGLFSGNTFFLAAISIIALVLVLVIFLFSGQQPRLVHTALGFFAAGVSGNLYDRVFNGGLVRDFIDVYYRDYHWPAFNVADSLLCIGVAVLLVPVILELFTRKPAQKHARRQK